MTSLSPAALKVQAALRQHGLDLQVVELAESTRTALEAAQAVGCELGQIVKSLVFRTRHSERAVLVRLGLGAPVGEQDLEEFGALAVSAGAVPVAVVTGSRKVPEPRYFVGSGKAEEIRAAAEAETIHAHAHLRVLKGVQGTADNLQSAIAGENFEVEEMYPAYDAVAKLQDEKGAIRSVHYAIEAEKIHAVMYGDVLKAAAAGQDAAIGTVHVCPVCGFTHIGEPPDRCPVCKAKKELFKAF